MTIGQQVRYWRKERGVTQAELAEKLDLYSSSSISDIETGRKDPGRDMLIRISELLDCEWVMVDKKTRKEAG